MKQCISLGERLRQDRKTLGFTQHSLANAINDREITVKRGDL